MTSADQPGVDAGWPGDTTAAKALQVRLRRQVDLANRVVSPGTVAGVDVSYAKDSDQVVAAAVVIDVATLATLESALVDGEATVPYAPGLLGFREVPLLAEALSRLARPPDVLVCDGYGVAHPRRFGLACHLGVVTGIPAFGVAKTPFLASFDDPGPQRGDFSALADGGEVLGRVVRTRDRVKPVFVSVGHRIDLDTATALTLRLCDGFRLPETTRRADHLSRAALRARGAARIAPARS